MDNINNICHRGGESSKPTNLVSMNKILEKYNDIDMVEIDVIYENDEFLINHDYIMVAEIQLKNILLH
jgi:hypothetical protein